MYIYLQEFTPRYGRQMSDAGRDRGYTQKQELNEGKYVNKLTYVLIIQFSIDFTNANIH